MSLPLNIKALIRPNILALQPYRCARDDYDAGILLDANENAYGPPFVESKDEELPHSILSTFNLERYPDPHQMKLKTIISAMRGTQPNQMAVGNGSDELIDLLMRIFVTPSSSEHIMICPPTYGMYKTTASVNDVGLIEVPLLPETFQLDVPKIFDTVNEHTKLLFLCSPGNPTACLLSKKDILEILSYPNYKGMVIVDEAYVDFALTSDNQEATCCDLVAQNETNSTFSRLIVMQTLSKAWGLAGIRLGMVFCHSSVAQIINNVKAPYNVNKVTAAIARQALSNGQHKLQETITLLMNERTKVTDALNAFPFVDKVYRSDSNFILFKLIENVDAKMVYRKIAESGVVIRYRGTQLNCMNCLRATVGTPEQNDMMLHNLNAVVEEMKKSSEIQAGEYMYRIVDAPEMIPVGFQKMVNDSINHKLIVRDNDPKDTRLVVIGSGFHVAVALTPLPLGVTPDIKNAFDANDLQGKITFASLEEICNSVSKATNVKIRKNPLDEKEKNCDPNDTNLLNEIKQERVVQLEEYKINLITWLKSLSNEHQSTHVTFVRNVYPMNPTTKQYVEENAKPVWCTGIGVDFCLDCGSGKVALVDGVLGTQVQNGETLKWDTETEWTEETIQEKVNQLKELVKGRKKTIAYGTGNWRKPHMENTWPKFQQALKSINVEFQLLPGELEAKYGGISSLKLAAPYVSECSSWVVVEMGGGSTQITRFAKVETK